jgi:Dolichyl-phosphate-mannose-protein mannosyltransferase
LWLVFPLIFVALYLSHFALLRLPYYWDEAGYYIPAAFDLFRSSALIPYSTLSNAHPPLPSLYLVLWWKISGFSPQTTRFAELIVASFALLAVYRLAQRVTGETSIAAATTLLTALYPVWFAQSTMAHADLLAAAFSLWGLVFYLPGGKSSRISPAALCFALAALSKETAICTPLALLAYEVWRAARNKSARAPALRNVAWLLAPCVVLAGWYVYHWRHTGFIFGNPGYLRYNALATLSPSRILLALIHRVIHLTLHMNLFVPVLCAFASLFLVPRPLPDGSIRPPLPRDYIVPLAWVFIANTLLFSVVGGALLTRYLLPLYPLVLLVCVAVFWRRVPAWASMIALAALAFCLGLFINPPYRFAPEDNLAYADAIRLQEDAIHQAVNRYPGQTILTAWPAADELTRPELGYIRRPVSVVSIDNFSLSQIQRAAMLPGYTVGLVFSTKYDPPHLPFSLGEHNEKLDRRYFDFHRDLPPEAIASLLGGRVVWREERKGQWAAILHFDRPQEARLAVNGTSTTVISAAWHAAL